MLNRLLFYIFFKLIYIDFYKIFINIFINFFNANIPFLFLAIYVTLI